MVSKIKDARKLNIWYSEDEFFDYGVTKHIGVSAAIVYFALCRHADRDGKAFPSVELLVQECGLSNRVVAKSTRTLKQFSLIEIKRNKHQHNIYYVQSVKNAITLNKWEKIASVKSTFAKKQVTIRHEASDESSPEQVTIRHEASDESSHEGLTIEGHTKEGLKKRTKIHTH
ncbi:hypothetical protein BGP_6112 [Beggiatoa sp. PS]|nr:hypothetical protein BGP_6112 [Beggiatoa sp. PS]